MASKEPSELSALFPMALTLIALGAIGGTMMLFTGGAVSSGAPADTLDSLDRLGANDGTDQDAIVDRNESAAEEGDATPEGDGDESQTTEREETSVGEAEGEETSDSAAEDDETNDADSDDAETDVRSERETDDSAGGEDDVVTDLS